MGRRKKKQDRVLGPYGFDDGQRWLVVLVDGRTGKRRRRSFTDRAAARRFARSAEAELQRTTGITIHEALNEYELHRRAKGNKVKSSAETNRRLRVFFTDHAVPLSALNPSVCEQLYTTFRQRKTKKGTTIAVDYHRNVLAEAKSFLRWAKKQGYIQKNPLKKVHGVGKRKHGKPQLRIDEARRWEAKALELAAAGRVGAVAAMMTLHLGLRASEITNRVVRDLDDDGHLLWIPEAKTERGKRAVSVPEILRPHLQRLAKDREAHEPLLGAFHRTKWVLGWVKRICDEAKVPRVCSHAMRGAFSSIAIGEAGLASEVVAQVLGHTSPTITHQSYATASSVANARQQRVLTVLNGGKR